MRNNYDVILVLGRGISPTGELPQSVHACIKKSVELYNENVAPRLIMSGKWSRSFDYTPPLTEARTMKDLAISQGIPADAIDTEESSLDTISNFYYTKKQFLLPNNWTRILLLTLPGLGGRPTYLMHKILGPEFVCDTLDIDFMFPPDKQAEKVNNEIEKLAKLQDFLDDIEDGDHETIFKMHMDYVHTHSDKQ